MEIYNLTIQNYGIGMYVTGNNTKITNNIVQNNYEGIYLSSSNHNNLTNNNLKNNKNKGFRIYISDNNTLTNNNSTNNHDGIYLEESNNNTLTNNNATNNNRYGIFIWKSNDNNLTNNKANNNNETGIWIRQGSNNNNLTNNNADNNEWNGILMESNIKNNTLVSNTANNNKESGIKLLAGGLNNTFINNTANNNKYGINLYTDAKNNTFVGNSICSNEIAIYFSGIGINEGNIFEFNRISFNSKAFENNGSNLVNNTANFNWWGYNALPSESTNFSGFKVDNWLIIQLNTIKTAILIGNNFTFDYYLLLNNGTRVNLDKFPFFNGTLNVNNVNSSFVDKTPFTKNGTIGTITQNVSVRLDDQLLSLVFTPVKIPTVTTAYDVSGIFGHDVNLRPKLTDNNGNLLANKKVNFYVEGKYIGSNITNANGIAIFKYLPKRAGNIKWTATFEGDMLYYASTGPANIKIVLQPVNPDNNNTTKNRTNNQTSNIPTSNASMKETGNPIIALIASLISICIIGFRRK